MAMKNIMSCESNNNCNLVHISQEKLRPEGWLFVVKFKIFKVQDILTRDTITIMIYIVYVCSLK